MQRTPETSRSSERGCVSIVLVETWREGSALQSLRRLHPASRPPLIKILITDAANFVAGGKEFSFSEQCLFFGVAGVIMMRSFWFVFFPWRNFFFFFEGEEYSS